MPPPAPPIEATPLHFHHERTVDDSAVVIHRVVSSASSLLPRGGGGGGGGVIVDDDGGTNGGTSTHTSTSSGMILGDGGMGGDIVASIVLMNRHNDDDAMRGGGTTTSTTTMVVTVQRMDGVTLASFELPPPKNGERFHTQPSKLGTANASSSPCRSWDEEGEGGGYRDSIMCWASFRNVRRHPSTDYRRRHDDDDDRKKTAITDEISSCRKMLCVLGNPSTLYVFDALGDTALCHAAAAITTPHAPSSGTGKYVFDRNGGDDGEGGMEGGGGIEGPGGHAISLPFSANSIFPNEDGGGLLLSRMPFELDYDAPAVAVHGRLAGGGMPGGGGGDDDDIPPTPMGSYLPATPRVLRRRRHRGNDAHRRDDIEDDDERDDEREDASLLVCPPPGMSLHFHDGGGYDAAGMGSSFVADDDDRHPPAIDVVDATIVDEGHDGVPCLFSLCHPLDEPHPLGVRVTTPTMGNDVGGDKDDDNSSSGFGADGNININVRLFSDVSERLVYVGSPRLFHGGTTTMNVTKTSPICVMYNERAARHTIWSLSRTANPARALPLWKTTGRGTWDSSSSSSFCSENTKPTIDLVGVEDDQDDDMNHQRRQQSIHRFGEASSRFSYIHPSFTLSKLFVDDGSLLLNPPPPPNFSAADAYADVDPSATEIGDFNDVSDGKFTMNRNHRNVFLATDRLGKGDLVLCVFIPNNSKANNGKNNVTQYAGDGMSDDFLVQTIVTPPTLRCYSLSCGHTQGGVVSIQSVSHLTDLPCLSAQPMQSIPIAYAPFSWEVGGEGVCGSSARKHTSRFHNLDRDTLATDILIVRKQDSVDGDIQNSEYDVDNEGKKGFTMGLYRGGAIHITDFTIPQSSLDAICLSSVKPTFVQLDNAVENRVDIRFLHAADNSRGAKGDVGHKGEKQEFPQPTTAILRVSFSLLIHASPIAETSLRAIESSLVHSSCQANYTKNLPFQHQPIRNKTFPVSFLATILPLLIRADTVRLFQHASRNAKMKNLTQEVEDDGWNSFTIVLLNLLGMKDKDGEESTLQTERKATEKNTSSSAAWKTLIHTDFHSTFCEGEGRILFGEDLRFSTDNSAVESTSTFTVDVSDGGCKYDVRSLSSLECVKTFEMNALDRGKGGDSDMLVHSYRQLIFDSLHLLHEDSRLVSLSRGLLWTRRLGTLLLHVAEQMSPLMLDYEDHFNRLLGSSRCLSNACICYSMQLKDKQRLSSFMTPPCILTCLDVILHLYANDFATEDAYGIAEFKFLLEQGLNGACSYSWMVLRLYIVLFDRNNVLSKTMFDVDPGFNQKYRDRATILAMLDEGVYHSYQLLDELPLCVAVPLLEVIRRCCLDPPQVDSIGDRWPTAAFDLVGRNDLAEFLTQSMLGSSFCKKSDFDDGTQSSDDIDSDGLVGLEDFSSMIFPDDNRVREAVRLLRSSRPLFLRVARPVELSDHEYERSKQEKLLLLCRRSIALPLGRGMLTLGTYHAPSAEQLVIPSIVMAGRVPPVNGTLALDMTACPTNFRVWPEFHNGVAAGLRLPHASEDTNAKVITRTWIKFNKPMYVAEVVGSHNPAQISTPSYAHGGFLMALGLRGYLSALTTIDLTDYLTQGTITTTVGIFLGMASNKRGSCDPSVSKMLCLHVPSLLPPSFLPMDLASPVQAAAVAGIGLLYQGSSHRLMTEFLLNEIGRQPAKDQNSNDRESFALVCGLALGMVNLKRGTTTVSGLEDLRIEERLHCYITGTNGGDFRRNEGFEGSVGRGIQEDMDWNSRIDEVTSPNTDVTASGATLALGLMYIRSQNASVAAGLRLPDTHFLLDYERPDMLALRVISRSLILWNDVQPTSEWIDFQIPSIVKSSINLMKNAAKRSTNASNNSCIDSYADIMDEQGDEKTKKEVNDFDPHAIRQANTYIISGACLALGLKYAGSANRAAASAIIERALWLLELRDNKDAVTLTQRPDNTTLVTCLCSVAISLAMVMSGTGDLDSFRLFRALRWKCDDGTLYGNHMAFGAAIGLLFLGGGKCTLGSRPEDVAVLVAAFYPHFPILSSDNQYHLQALRHLYVLAVHERILEACDVDSHEKVCIPIELTVADSNEVVRASTPLLVANDSNFALLRSKSERYYPIVINVTDWNTCGNLCSLFVKRKAGHLSYFQDPNGLRSLSLQQVEIADNKSFLNSVNLFSDDAKLTSFAKFFCSSSFDADKSFERCCTHIAYECLKEEKSFDILAVYVKIFKLIDSIGQKKLDVEDVSGARLLMTYVETRERLGNEQIATASSLMNREAPSLLCESIDNSFQVTDSMLQSLANRRPEQSLKGDNHASVSAFLAWTGVPLTCSSMDKPLFPL